MAAHDQRRRFDAEDARLIGNLGKFAAAASRLQSAPRRGGFPAMRVPAAPEHRSGRLRILVVDDNRDAADALAWLLQSIGHEASAAYDGPSALLAAERHSPQAESDAIPITGSTRVLLDLVLVLCVSPGKTCAESGVMLARVRPSGIFELLTAAAWARALGYPPEELSGKSLRELMQLEKPAPGELVTALLDETGVQPLDVTLRCKDARRKSFRLYRRYDAYEKAVFVVADELGSIAH